jgi:NAD(P)H-hydrate epimerase
VIPVVTPAEMAAIDAAASESVDVLVERAGAAVARAALDEMGGAYGRRVVVVAGPGSNGADGRVAAQRLARRGVRTTVIDAAAAPARLPTADLVIDAAYGTGLRRPYEAPGTDAPVLAVDLPSGVDGLTGCVLGHPARAVRTITFAALKPGLLFGEGPRLAGRVEVADIGLDVSSADVAVVEDADMRVLVPPRPPSAHKWQSACWVIAGSPGMEGAAQLAATAAQRAGAGYVRLSVPGASAPTTPVEVVGHPIDPGLLVGTGELERFASVVVGPGLGTAVDTVAGVLRLVSRATGPMVVDGDGLTALAGGSALEQRRGVGPSAPPLVLTPHDGEFERLTGGRPGSDRIVAARALAVTANAVVLLKGPTTVVAAPDGRVLLVTSGDQRLATAGTGDVLAGMIGAILARGADPLGAAAAAAHIHGLIAAAGPETGVVAGDLPALLVARLEALGVDGAGRGAG